MYFYVYVCLSVRSHNSKTTWPNFTKFFVHVALLMNTHGCGLVLWWRYDTLFTSGFVDDIVFSHNGSVALCRMYS